MTWTRKRHLRLVHPNPLLRRLGCLDHSIAALRARGAATRATKRHALRSIPQQAPAKPRAKASGDAQAALRGGAVAFLPGESLEDYTPRKTRNELGGA